jgi:hypothetical protein
MVRRKEGSMNKYEIRLYKGEKYGLNYICEEM